MICLSSSDFYLNLNSWPTWATGLLRQPMSPRTYPLRCHHLGPGLPTTLVSGLRQSVLSPISLEVYRRSSIPMSAISNSNPPSGFTDYHLAMRLTSHDHEPSCSYGPAKTKPLSIESSQSTCIAQRGTRTGWANLTLQSL